MTSGAARAGLATYSASRAFDLILGESLWAELKPLDVDVLSIVLGPTDTPAFRRVLHGREFPEMADPEEVARGMLDHLADGPGLAAGRLPSDRAGRHPDPTSRLPL